MASVMWPRLFPELMTKFREPVSSSPRQPLYNAIMTSESTKRMSVGAEGKKGMLSMHSKYSKASDVYTTKTTSKPRNLLSCLGLIIRRHSSVFNTLLA